jgi:hypothetical protein
MKYCFFTDAVYIASNGKLRNDYSDGFGVMRWKNRLFQVLSMYLIRGNEENQESPNQYSGLADRVSKPRIPDYARVMIISVPCSATKTADAQPRMGYTSVCSNPQVYYPSLVTAEVLQLHVQLTSGKDGRCIDSKCFKMLIWYSFKVPMEG